MNSGWAIENFAWAVSAHAALPWDGHLIACPSLLFLDLCRR